MSSANSAYSDIEFYVVYGMTDPDGRRRIYLHNFKEFIKHHWSDKAPTAWERACISAMWGDWERYDPLGDACSSMYPGFTMFGWIRLWPGKETKYLLVIDGEGIYGQCHHVWEFDTSDKCNKSIRACLSKTDSDYMSPIYTSTLESYDSRLATSCTVKPGEPHEGTVITKLELGAHGCV